MNPIAQTAPRQAYFPGDPEWDDVRRAWNLAVDQQPGRRLRPGDRRRRRRGRQLRAPQRPARRVQGTGHGAAPLGSLEDTVLVKTAPDAGDRDRLRERRRARAGAGVIWERGRRAGDRLRPDRPPRLLARRRRRRLYARRRHRLARAPLRPRRELVTAVELVTADGEHVRADADNEPDLFWGLRGGGGNFGAVTAIEFALYPVEHAYAAGSSGRGSARATSSRRWAELTEPSPTRSRRSRASCACPPAPFIPEPFRGRDLVVVEATYLGEEERGRSCSRRSAS